MKSRVCLPALVALLGVIQVAAASNDAWYRIYTPELTEYARNLRAAGVPADTVTLLISHEVNMRFRDREAALQPSTVTAKSLKDDFSPERREALVQLRLEKHQLLRAALGVVPQEKAQYEWAPHAVARLTPEQRDLVRAIMDDYDAMIARIQTEARGHFLDEDREKIRFLESERGNDLRRLLAEDEVLDFEIAETSFGRSLRGRLRLFEPTAEQLRTYLQLAKKHDIVYAPRAGSSAELRKMRRGFEADLAAAWGAETYARYRRTTSNHFPPVLHLVRRLKLDDAVAVQIFESTRRVTEESVRIFQQHFPWASLERPPINSRATMYVTLQPDQVMSDKVAKDGIKRLADEHCALVRSLLGDAGFREYHDFARGWIEQMQRGRYVHLDFSMEL